MVFHPCCHQHNVLHLQGGTKVSQDRHRNQLYTCKQAVDDRALPESTIYRIGTASVFPTTALIKISGSNQCRQFAPPRWRSNSPSQNDKVPHLLPRLLTSRMLGLNLLTNQKWRSRLLPLARCPRPDPMPWRLILLMKPHNESGISCYCQARCIMLKVPGNKIWSLYYPNIATRQHLALILCFCFKKHEGGICGLCN